MEIAQLKSFAALAEILNFRHTARNLGLSQSTVSRQISELEQSLGIQLFDRSSRRVALTAGGAALLPYALDILGTVRSAEQVVQRFRSGVAGHLNISALATCGTVVTRALDAFFHMHPDTIVDVSLQTAAGQKTALAENRFDLYFIGIGMLPENDTWSWQRTHQDTLSVVVRKGHPAAGRPLDFTALKDERFIISQELYNADLYQQIIAVCAAHDYVPNIMNRYDKLESVLLAVGAGLGISILPTALTTMLFADKVDAIPIMDTDTRRTYIAAWRKTNRNPAVPLFLECLRSETKN